MGYTVQYYDLVLAAIAASLLAGVGIGLATTIALTTAIALLALVGLAIIVHALFVNGPVDDMSELGDQVETQDLPV